MLKKTIISQFKGEKQQTEEEMLFEYETAVRNALDFHKNSNTATPDELAKKYT